MNLIQEKIKDSLVEFIKENRILLIQDVNEKAICHGIAKFMSGRFQGRDIDVEYDRLGAEQKQKLISTSQKRFLQYKKQGIVPNNKVNIDKLCENPEKAPDFPDIIVHKRTEIFNNLLIVEVKKEKNPELFNGWDEWKIEFFLNTFHYQYGAQVVLKTAETYNDPLEYISMIKLWPQQVYYEKSK